MRNIVSKIALIMSIILVMTLCPSNITNAEQLYCKLYEENQIINDNDKKYDQKESTVYLPASQYELEMGKIYKYDVFRSGNLDKKQSVKLYTSDISAGYGVNYEILKDVKLLPSKVEGKEKLILDCDDTAYRAYDMGDSEEQKEQQKQATKLEQNTDPVIIKSSQTQIDFEEGQKVATFYIKVMKTEKSYGNLNFSIGLEQTNKSLKIGETSSTNFTIKDERKAESAEITVDENIKADYKQGVVEVPVYRENNTRNYCIYKVKTESDSAVAGKDYVAVSDEYVFSPGMKKQIIEVPIINNGQTDTKEFNFTIETCSAGEVKNDTTKVTLADTGVYVNASYRKTYDTLNTNDFVMGKSTCGDNYKKLINNGSISYVNLYSETHYGFSIKSPENINWNLYNGISVLGTHDKGGKEKNCKLAIYAGNTDNGTNTFDAGQISPSSDKKKNRIGDDLGYSWNLDDILLDTNEWKKNKNIWHNLDVNFNYKGSAPLYITLQQSKSVNHTDYYLDTEIKLKKKLFKVTLLKDAISNVNVARADGETDEINPVNNSALIINNASSDNNGKIENQNYVTDLYSGEEITVINTDMDSQSEYVKFSGFALCDKDGEDKIVIDGVSDTKLTIDDNFISKYIDHIYDNNIYIVPIYSAVETNFEVIPSCTYSDKETLDVDSNNQKAVYKYQGKKVADISWENSVVKNRGNKYYSGDEICISTTIDDEYKNNVELAGYKIIVSSDKNVSEEVEKNYDIVKTVSGKYTIKLEKEMYYKIIPLFTKKDSKPTLNVVNSEYGDFTGKSDKNATGKYKSEIYANSSVGQLLIFSAAPKDGYEAKWTYKDAVTEKDKVIYGKRFYYYVQSTMLNQGNDITLEFVKISDRKDTERVDCTVNAEVNIQEATLMKMPSINDENYVPYDAASINFENFKNEQQGSSGKYTLAEKEYIGQNENGENEYTVNNKINVGLNDTYTVLVGANGKSYVKEVKIADVYKDGKINFKFDLGYYNLGSYIEETKVTSSGLGEITKDVQVLKEMQTTTMSFKVHEGANDINTLRINIYSKDGMKYNHFDIKETKDGSDYYDWISMLTETISAGDKIGIEMMYVERDDSGEIKKEITYGETDLGITFVNPANIGEVGYLPDIGDPDASVVDVDIFGEKIGILPSFTFGPLKPTATVSHDSTKDVVVLILGVTIGNYDIYNDKNLPSAKDKINQTKRILTSLSKKDANRQNNGLARKNASAAGKTSPITVNFIVNATAMAQITFKLDSKDQEPRVLQIVLFAGVDATVRISASLLQVCSLPVFCTGTATAKFSISTLLVPVAALKADKITDAKQYVATCLDGTTMNIGSEFSVGIGLGIDGLLAASGSLIMKPNMTMKDLTVGKVTCGISGQLKFDVILFSIPMTIDFVTINIYDNTKKQQAAVTQAVYQEIKKLDNTKLGDLNTDDLEVKAPLKRGVNANGEYSEKNIINTKSEKAQTKLIPITSGKYAGDYMVLLVAKSDEQNTSKVANISYQIVDKDGNAVTDFELINSKLSQEDLENADFNPSFVDAGDYIAVSWSTQEKGQDKSAVSDYFKNLGAETALFNKNTGEFEKSVFNKDSKDSIVQNKMAYDKENNKLIMLYTEADYNSLTEESTIEDIKKIPTQMKYQSIDLNDLKSSSIKEIPKEYEYATYSDITTINNVPYISCQESNTIETQDSNAKTQIKLMRLAEKDNQYSITNTTRIDDNDSLDSKPFFTKTKYKKDGKSYDDTLIMWQENESIKYKSLDSIEKLKDEKELGSLEEYLDSRTAFTNMVPGANDNFTMVSDDDGNIYALFTVMEGKEKQIYASRFELTDFDLVNEKITYEGNKEISTPIKEPIYEVNGIWGKKMKLTTDGVFNSKTHGLYKGSLSAVATDNNGQLTVLYNAYDFNIDSENDKAIIKDSNNEVILSKFDVKTKYQFINEIEASNPTPMPGECEQISVELSNTGLDHGKEVPINLYEIINGQKKLVDTKVIKDFPSGSSKEMTFEYTVPSEVNADITLQAETPTSTSEVKLNNKPLLKIEDTVSSDAKYFYDNAKGTIKVSATIVNKGNKKSEAGKVILDRIDNEKLKNNEDNVNFTIGETEIPALDVGESAAIVIYSNQLEKSYFNGVDNGMECTLASYSGDKLSSVSESIIADLPVPDKIGAIEAKDINIKVGETSNLDYTIYPKTAAPYNSLEFTCDDDSVLSVNEYGSVTGLKEGTAEVSIKDKNGDAISKVSIKVTKEAINNGDDNNNGGSGNNGSGTDNNGDNAKTGNVNNILIYCLLVLAALTVVTYCYRKKRIN